MFIEWVGFIADAVESLQVIFCVDLIFTEILSKISFVVNPKSSKTSPKKGCNVVQVLTAFSVRGLNK